MEIEQKLGIRVFFYYLSRKITTGVLLLIVSIVLSSFKSTLISLIVFLLPLKTATIVIQYLLSGLFIISIIFILAGIIMAWLSYMSCSFVLNDNSLDIKRGILNKKEISILCRQIQDIYTKQSFSDRMMGVSRLVISTAGDDDKKGGESDGIFEVIDSKIAENIKNNVLQKANVQVIRK